MRKVYPVPRGGRLDLQWYSPGELFQCPSQLTATEASSRLKCPLIHGGLSSPLHRSSSQQLMYFLPASLLQERLLSLLTGKKYKSVQVLGIKLPPRSRGASSALLRILDLHDLLKNFQCYHLQGKKWSLQPSCSHLSSPGLSHKREPKGDQWGAVPGYQALPTHHPHHINLPQISSWILSTIPRGWVKENNTKEPQIRLINIGRDMFGHRIGLPMRRARNCLN